MNFIIKNRVHDFWNEKSCGEDLYLKNDDMKSFYDQQKVRYELEPYILDFLKFDNNKSKVLEIGVGLGADHLQLALAGHDLYGIDLTNRAIRKTIKRFEQLNLKSDLRVGDAECLGFEDNYFDNVYSWGVLHHTPNTEKSINEVYRVIKKGGTAKVMIYNKYSIVAFMLWIRYGLFKFNPMINLDELYAKYLESPGTKAYTKKQARNLFAKFSEVDIKIIITHADLLESEVGQRHRGTLLSLVKKIWPRKIIRKFFHQNGLFMLITAIK